ncbi:uncharacterized protein LOC120086132 [Benincasa hispida]|uniref:uncharacterized protein LOC120086132 n=1 Tax=Benincasa hispida TaxID=102211 RepID=UPI0018FF26BC|nr:uncharacterized protein LOC120086132 [Benincasa hispida]
MATNLAVFHPAPIRASSSGKSEPNRRKATAPKWWSPIFGWSSEPDYVLSSAAEQSVLNAEPELEGGRTRSRFAPGCFTEEKAKLLRMKTLESSTFHDIMYHSAIASRLASDLSDRSKK